jgi:hypothetical protein
VYDTCIALCKTGFIRINVADTMNYLKLVVKIAYIELGRKIVCVCVYIYIYIYGIYTSTYITPSCHNSRFDSGRYQIF